MKSLDTNVLLAGLDRSHAFHAKALPLYEALLNEEDKWVVADQVLFELYRLVRNPSVVQRPLSMQAAVELLEWLRGQTRARHTGYDPSLFPEVIKLLKGSPDRKGLIVFDATLAVTLKTHGVTTFYTRNVKDFLSFGLFEVVDPFA